MTADVALFSILACLPFSSAHKISLYWLLTVRCLLMSCFLVAWPLKTLWMDFSWLRFLNPSLRAPLRVSKALSPIKLWWSTVVTSRKEATVKSCERKVHYSFIILRLTNSVYKDRNYILILINAKKEINPIRNLFYGYQDKGKKNLPFWLKQPWLQFLLLTGHWR